MACFSGGQTTRLVAVLCDGAGSATMGGQGSVLAARMMSVRAREYSGSNGPDDETIRRWIDDVRDAIGIAAQRRHLRPRDFATTLICILSDGFETTTVHIGDGCAVAKDAASGEWKALTWPAHGEYASTTYFITDDIEPRVTINRHLGAISGVVAFTDGLERLALDFSSHKPHAPFFEMVFPPVVASSVSGRDTVLSLQLDRYLDSAAVNARTDDDKTLLVAALG